MTDEPRVTVPRTWAKFRILNGEETIIDTTCWPVQRDRWFQDLVGSRCVRIGEITEGGTPLTDIRLDALQFAETIKRHMESGQPCINEIWKQARALIARAENGGRSGDDLQT